MRRAHQLCRLDARRGGPSCSGRRCTSAPRRPRRARPTSRRSENRRGVAEVVDDLAAEADHQAGRHVRGALRRGRGVPGRHEPHPATPSNSTVPPMFGSDTFSTPAPPSSLAISTIATTCAPVRLAMSTDVAVVVGVAVREEDVRRRRRSSASTAAFGLPVRNGSMRTRVSPSVSSKQAWPRKRMSIQSPWVVLRRRSSRASSPADRDADEHAHAGLLGEQRLDALGARAVVGLGEGAERTCER